MPDFRSPIRAYPAARLALVSFALLAVAAAAAAQSSRYLPSVVTQGAKSLGSEAPTATLRATVWLKMHHRDQFDAAVQQLYTPGSATFHHWMTAEQISAFEPTAAEVSVVRSELGAHHLAVVAVDPENLSVTFTGQVADFESAFNTQLERYQAATGTMRVAMREPLLAGAATGLVAAVTGFEGTVRKSHLARPRDARTGNRTGLRPLAEVKPDGLVFSNQCIGGRTSISLSGPGSTTAQYAGYSYGADPTNTAPGTVGPCGYSPQDVWGLYGLNGLYKLGLQGAGQTVVIIDAYGSPTLAADLATFSTANHLPGNGAASLQIYKPTPFTATNQGWAEETTLDVEWAHAVAPAANIALVAAPSAQNNDLDAALLYAIQHQLGNVISNSYGSLESETSAADLQASDEIIEMAAAKGIAVQFSSGDDGDYSHVLGGRTDVSSPADSTYATAVGGTSVVFSPAPQVPVLQTGWGTNITELSPSNSTVDNPPFSLGFQGGAGGGVSGFFAKPSWQSGLAGAGRHLPDVSAIADPYTGVEVIMTMNGQQFIEIVGGTSLASPVFSAIWALADEYNGASLGQAAPYIAQGSPYVVDVLPGDLNNDTTGSITANGSTTNYSASALAGPLDGNTAFASALWNYGGGTYYNLTFGTDTSLTVTPGWDAVTGYGTPSFLGLPQQ